MVLFFIKILNFFKNISIETGKTALILFKIMIPISIIVKIIQELNLLPYIGKALAPIMNLVGLPGETGLVWASAMLVNLYGGILAYFSLVNDLSLTVSQVTILFTMLLVAHTFPIELQIAGKAGIKIIVMFLIRFVFAIVLGIILFHLYRLTGFLQETAEIPKIIKQIDHSWQAWIVNELKNYISIFIFIFGLLTILSVLRITHIIDHINKLLYPVLKILGIGKEVIPIAVVGLTLGISYGGAIIIRETQNKNVSPRDVFYALTLMGLCHSIIEDTLLLYALGGNISGILFARVIFALIITYFIVRLTKKLSDKTFEKWFLKKNITQNSN